jgi:hypothetical protein
MVIIPTALVLFVPEVRNLRRAGGEAERLTEDP